MRGNDSIWACANYLTVSRFPHPKSVISGFYSPVEGVLHSAYKMCLPGLFSTGKKKRG